jgi:hypothetical protein
VTRRNTTDGLSQLAMDDSPTGKSKQESFRERAIISDMKFCDVMMEAIRLGQECSSVGVYVDERPLRSWHVVPSIGVLGSRVKFYNQESATCSGE